MKANSELFTRTDQTVFTISAFRKCLKLQFGTTMFYVAGIVIDDFSTHLKIKVSTFIQFCPICGKRQISCHNKRYIQSRPRTGEVQTRHEY